jgi:hypothetical protein
LFVSSDITLYISHFSDVIYLPLLMIGQSWIYCCPVLDNFGKKGGRGILAVFGACSNRAFFALVLYHTLNVYGLEATSCECYQVVKSEFDRLRG